ncbi:MAG: carbohydrate binding family 9 domain-containing protein [Flavobacteriaceae bacterium]|nr:carbohydrate binding family 9 domain-containing protein [Flavobacteriaceae bacterium]
MRSKFLLLNILIYIPIILIGQVNTDDYRLSIQKTNEKIKIDGVLEEAAWKNAAVAKDFFMITPVDTGKATQFSEARVSFDDENLYIAIIFFNNSTQGKYVVESLKRDFSFGKNDNFLVAIDPFNNQNTGFAFGLNAYGAQWDGTMYDGRSVDLNWDTKWYSEVQFDEEKWVCEIAIPFKSIRYNEEITEWGINFSRLDLKASEKSSWAPIPRQFPSVTLAYAGALVWDSPPPKQSSNVSLIPYLSNNLNSQDNATPNNTFKVGGDLKYSLTSALNLDVTVNPDFSQAEVDQQVTNLDRFELFFPERRQFFLENGDLFSNFGYTTIRPFFSRRIGLNVPIQGGIRLSGNLDENWRIGIMDIQTRQDEGLNLAAENFGVVTLQRKVFDRSNLSVIFVNKQAINLNNDQNNTSAYNRNVGLEYNYFSADNLWNGKLLFLKSLSPLAKQQGEVFASHIGYQSTRWNWRLQQEYISGNYSAEVGFIPRNNYIKLQATGGYLYYTNKETPLLSHGPRVGRTYYFDTDFNKKDQTQQLDYLFNFKNRSRFTLGIRRQYIELLTDFDPLRTQIAKLTAGTKHEWNSFTFSYDAKPQNRFTYSAELITGGYYDNGKRNAFLGEFGYRFQPYLELSSLVNYNKIELPAPWNTNSFWLLGIKSNLTLTNKIFFSNLFQYNEQLGLWNFNSRFQWRYKPASDIFLVFNSNEISVPNVATGWNLTLKVNYWLNL